MEVDDDIQLLEYMLLAGLDALIKLDLLKWFAEYEPYLHGGEGLAHDNYIRFSKEIEDKFIHTE